MPLYFLILVDVYKRQALYWFRESSLFHPHAFRAGGTVFYMVLQLNRSLQTLRRCRLISPSTAKAPSRWRRFRQISRKSCNETTTIFPPPLCQNSNYFVIFHLNSFTDSLIICYNGICQAHIRPSAAIIDIEARDGSRHFKAAVTYVERYNAGHKALASLKRAIKAVYCHR